MVDLCPCESGKNYDECCEPLLTNKRQAKTAEELMRSRFVAFTKANVDYLLKTHHPKNRANSDRKKIKRWAQSVEWVGLAIVSCEMGSEYDESGTVTFRAFYIDNDQYQQIYEESKFVKIDEKWFYLDGIDLEQENQERAFSL